jgi:predicted RND superfamily exporter protein
MEYYFPPGLASPFYITIDEKDPNYPNGTFTEQFFEYVNNLISLIDNAIQGAVTSKSVISAPLAYGNSLPFEIAQMLTDPKTPLYNSSEGALYRSLLSTVMTADQKASLIIMLVTFDPNGPLMESFYKKTLGIIEQFHKSSLYNWNITGILASNIDLSSSAFDAFPMMIGITLAIVVVFITISIRSLILPIRLVITIGLTILWTYG